MGKHKTYLVTIGRTNTDGTFRTNTYNVSNNTLRTWVDSWLEDPDAISINIAEVEDA